MRKLAAAVDFGFVSELVGHYYCRDNGRPSWDPLVLVKAEQKKYHGLGQARYWGLAKVTIQVLITCIVVNCKKIAKLLTTGLRPAAVRPSRAPTWRGEQSEKAH